MHSVNYCLCYCEVDFDFEYLCKDCYFRFDVNHMQITYAKAKVIWYPALCLDYSEYVYVYMSEICFGFIVVML